MKQKASSHRLLQPKRNEPDTQREIFSWSAVMLLMPVEQPATDPSHETPPQPSSASKTKAQHSWGQSVSDLLCILAVQTRPGLLLSMACVHTHLAVLSHNFSSSSCCSLTHSTKEIVTSPKSGPSCFVHPVIYWSQPEWKRVKSNHCLLYGLDTVPLQTHCQTALTLM